MDAIPWRELFQMALAASAASVLMLFFAVLFMAATLSPWTVCP